MTLLRNDKRSILYQMQGCQVKGHSVALTTNSPNFTVSCQKLLKTLARVEDLSIRQLTEAQVLVPPLKLPKVYFVLVVHHYNNHHHLKISMLENWQYQAVYLWYRWIEHQFKPAVCFQLGAKQSELQILLFSMEPHHQVKGRQNNKLC